MESLAQNYNYKFNMNVIPRTTIAIFTTDVLVLQVIYKQKYKLAKYIIYKCMIYIISLTF